MGQLMIDGITLALIVFLTAIVSGLLALGLGIIIGGVSQLIFRTKYINFLREKQRETEEQIANEKALVENRLHEQVATTQAQISQIYREALHVQQQNEEGSSEPVGGGIMN